MGEQLALPVFSPPLVMEGGSVSVNGRGTFMATDSSIINDNRNPGLSKGEIEKVLAPVIGRIGTPVDSCREVCTLLCGGFPTFSATFVTVLARVPRHHSYYGRLSPLDTN